MNVKDGNDYWQRIVLTASWFGLFHSHHQTARNNNNNNNKKKLRHGNHALKSGLADSSGRDLCYATLYNFTCIFFFYLIKEIPTPAFLKIVFNNVITSCANIRYMRKCTAQCMYEKHRKPSSREHNLFFLYIELLKPRSWCERERLIPFIAAITTYSQQHSLVLTFTCTE